MAVISKKYNAHSEFYILLHTIALLYIDIYVSFRFHWRSQRITYIVHKIYINKNYFKRKSFNI